MTRDAEGRATLAEVAAMLADYGPLLCAPRAEEDDGLVTLTVTVHPEGQSGTAHALAALELMQRLRYLQDVSTLRGLAARYDIPAAQLEALLPAPVEVVHAGEDVHVDRLTDIRVALEVIHRETTWPTVYRTGRALAEIQAQATAALERLHAFAEHYLALRGFAVASRQEKT